MPTLAFSILPHDILRVIAHRFLTPWERISLGCLSKELHVLFGWDGPIGGIPVPFNLVIPSASQSRRNIYPYICKESCLELYDLVSSWMAIPLRDATHGLRVPRWDSWCHAVARRSTPIKDHDAVLWIVHLYLGGCSACNAGVCRACLFSNGMFGLKLMALHGYGRAFGRLLGWVWEMGHLPDLHSLWVSTPSTVVRQEIQFYLQGLGETPLWIAPLMTPPC